MRNQIEMADRIGIRAATINSNNPEEWDAVKADLKSNNSDILLISPNVWHQESLMNFWPVFQATSVW